MDEPDAHLHADSHLRLYDAVRGIATETRTPVVFANHSPQVIQRLMYDPEAALIWMSDGAKVPADEARRPAIPILMTVGALTAGAELSAIAACWSYAGVAGPSRSAEPASAATINDEEPGIVIIPEVGRSQAGRLTACPALPRARPQGALAAGTTPRRSLSPTACPLTVEPVTIFAGLARRDRLRS